MRNNAFARLIRGETSFDFVGRAKVWFCVSGTVILIGLIVLSVRGLNFSIDFKGGTVWEVPSKASVSQVKTAIASVDPSLSQATIQILTDSQTNQRTIKVSASSSFTAKSTELSSVTQKLADLSHVSTNDVEEDDVGPSWGSDITNKAVEAVIIFLIAVAGYIWLRFEGKMAAAALTALVHDILITLGIYAISGFQVSPDTVIAFLTILGYSLYDTIVVFDKVQENVKSPAISGRMTYSEMVNLSMNQVLARSLNTSLVAVIPIFAILVIGAGVLGASALSDFGLALFVGLTTGAYSSIFIASPLLAILKEKEPKYEAIRKRTSGSERRLTPATAAMGRSEGTSVAEDRPKPKRPTAVPARSKRNRKRR